MKISLSATQARRLQSRAQQLTPQKTSQAGVTAIIRDVCGLQAQELASATLGIRARSTGLLATDVEYARVHERSIIRTWGLRGTLHLLATDDLRWLLPVYGPFFSAASRSRRAELGLDDATCTEASHKLRQTLAEHGPLTRAEIVKHLADKGTHLEGQAVPHLIGYCALNGMLCHGPEQQSEPTYVLLEDWITGWIVSAQQPLAVYADLALRYLAAYGPAQPEDMAAWSGLPLRDIRAGWNCIADQLLEVEIANQPAWLLKTQAAWVEEVVTDTTVVRLLPRYDTYLLGYKNRNLIVPMPFAKRVNAGGGIIHPTLVVDGQAVGTWKSTKRKDHLDIMVEPFETLAPNVQPGLEAEVEDIGRFLGIPTTLRA